MIAIGNARDGTARARVAAATLVAVAAIWLALGGLVAAETERSHAGEQHEGHAGEEHDHDAGLVRLTPAELEEFGIQVAAAGPGTIEASVSLPGEVRPNADRLAHIVPRYSGIVTEVRAHIGDVVHKGQVLAVVESDESLVPYELKTLIAGTVINKHITLGEAVSRDNETYVIADLSTVWVDLTVYQKDISRVRVGQRALIFAGHGLADVAGTISYVTPVVDEETRTATARVVVPNADGTWRPGMFVTARVLVNKTEVPVAVPRTALHTLDEQAVVFVQTDDGFRTRPVTLGRSGETAVEILSGLEPGQRYVSRGGFTLKAELQKASFGEGHAH